MDARKFRDEAVAACLSRLQDFLAAVERDTRLAEGTLSRIMALLQPAHAPRRQELEAVEAVRALSIALEPALSHLVLSTLRLAIQRHPHSARLVLSHEVLERAVKALSEDELIANTGLDWVQLKSVRPVVSPSILQVITKSAQGWQAGMPFITFCIDGTEFTLLVEKQESMLHEPVVPAATGTYGCSHPPTGEEGAASYSGAPAAPSAH